MARKLTTEEFIEKSRLIHSNENLEYTKVIYINSHTKVCIIDHDINPKTGEEYGEYFITPNNLLNGQHHPAKGKLLSNELHKTGLTNFIRRAKKIHKHEKLDYSKFIYVNMKTKGLIIDHDINPETGKEYGEYWQTPASHLSGTGHPNKGRIIQKESLRLKTDDFIKRAKKSHLHEKLDYSKVHYINAKTKVCIIDHDINPLTGEEFGEYWQLPYEHLSGSSNPLKKGYKISNSSSYKNNEIIEIFKNIHPEFDFSKVNYKGYQEPILIKCNKHGWFKTTPDLFIHSVYGCPKCSFSASSHEEEILFNYLSSLYNQNLAIIRNDRNILSGKELDISIPCKKLSIEFNGIFWHSTASKDFKGIDYHLNKTEECEEKGIHLIHIFEDEWVNHQELVKERMKYILGKSDKPRIGARKCCIQKVSKSISDDFLTENSLEGKANVSIYLGAYYQEQLVSVMLFKKTKNEGEYELVRFASSNQFIVQGIASKLLRHFMRNYNPKSIIALADRRWVNHTNNIYINLGFKEEEIIKPDFDYFKSSLGIKRFKKSDFTKKKMLSMFPDKGLNDDMTKEEMQEILSIYKIYNCGQIKYRLKI